MTQKSTAALLDAAMVTLQHARQELDGASAPATAETALARLVRRYDELEASDFTAEEQAQAYEESAGVLRRRRERLGGSIEAQRETDARVQYFKARAAHKREGSPLALTLRTGNEHLGYVDALRRELADVVDLVQQVSRDEVSAFSVALGSPTLQEEAAAAFEELLLVLGALLFSLGVSREPEGLAFAAYRKIAPGPAAPPMEEPAPETSAPAMSNGASATPS